MRTLFYQKKTLCSPLRKSFASFAVKKAISISFAFLFLVKITIAQLPNTDIWLLDVKSIGDSIVLSNPNNITNRVGYDNQPTFSPKGDYILYTSIRDEKQSDIFKYDLKTKQISQFTNTVTSEYSPTFMPDGKNISVVMVEPDSTQRIWKYSIKGGAAKVQLAHVDSVGYHCWFVGKRAAVYLLTEPHSLCLASDDYKTPRYIDNSIGRCIKFKNSMIYYTKTIAEGKHQFRVFNLPGWHVKENQSYIETEDFEFVGKRVIYGLNSEIISTSAYVDDKRKVIDLSAFGIKNISRMAINADGTKLAIVAESK